MSSYIDGHAFVTTMLSISSRFIPKKKKKEGKKKQERKITFKTLISKMGGTYIFTSSLEINVLSSLICGLLFISASCIPNH